MTRNYSTPPRRPRRNPTIWTRAPRRAIARRLQQPRLNNTMDRYYDRVVEAIVDDAEVAALNEYVEENRDLIPNLAGASLDRFLELRRQRGQAARNVALQPFVQDLIAGVRRPENEAEVRRRVVNNIRENLSARRVLNLDADEEVVEVVIPEGALAAREVLAAQPGIRIMRRYPNADPYNLEPSSS